MTPEHRDARSKSEEQDDSGQRRLVPPRGLARAVQPRAAISRHGNVVEVAPDLFGQLGRRGIALGGSLPHRLQGDGVEVSGEAPGVLGRRRSYQVFSSCLPGSLLLRCRNVTLDKDSPQLFLSRKWHFLLVVFAFLSEPSSSAFLVLAHVAASAFFVQSHMICLLRSGFRCSLREQIRRNA